MSPLTDLSRRLGVTEQELQNLLTLFVLSVVSGVGLFVVRGQVPFIDAFAQIRTLEFSLAYVLMGLLPVLFLRAVTPEGKALVVFLFVGLGIGLLAAPQLDVINLVVGLLVFFGGLTYFGVSASASNYELLIVVSLLLVQGYLYMLLYIWAMFQRTGGIRIPALSVTFLTLVLYVVYRFLSKEMARSTSGSGWRP